MIETIRNLLEIQSIDLHIKKHLDAIEQQTTRITRIRSDADNRKKQQNSDMAAIESKKASNLALEKELATIDAKISRAKHNLDLIKSQAQANALNNELKNLGKKKEEIEGIILVTIEAIDGLQKKIAETNQFLDGVQQSITEIEEEVKLAVAHEEKEISILSSRLTNLENLLDPKTKSLFRDLNIRFKYKYPLSIVGRNVCSQCHFNVERNLQSIVEKGATIEQCPNCSRILCPSAALK